MYLKGKEWRNAIWGISYKLDSTNGFDVVRDNKIDVCGQEVDNTKNSPSLESLPKLPQKKVIQTISSSRTTATPSIKSPSIKHSSIEDNSCTCDSSTKHWITHFVFAFLSAVAFINLFIQRKYYRGQLEVKDMELEHARMEKKLCHLQHDKFKEATVNTHKSHIACICNLKMKLTQAIQMITNLKSKNQEEREFHELQMRNTTNYFEMEMTDLKSKNQEEREFHGLQIRNTTNYYEMKMSNLLKTLEVQDTLMEGYKFYKKLYQEQSLGRLDQFNNAASFLYQQSRNNLMQIETLQQERNSLMVTNDELKKKITTFEEEIKTISLKREKELREILLLRLKLNKVFQ